MKYAVRDLLYTNSAGRETEKIKQDWPYVDNC